MPFDSKGSHLKLTPEAEKAAEAVETFAPSDDPHQWMLRNLMGEVVNAFVELGRDGLDGKLFKGRNQRMGEAVQSISVLHNRIPLSIIQNFPYLLRRVFAMIKKRNEASDGALEINIVLPERVIGIDEQGLSAILPVHTSNHSASGDRGEFDKLESFNEKLWAPDHSHSSDVHFRIRSTKGNS